MSHLVHDGQDLWLATHGRYECTGNPPVSGLIQYDGEERRATSQWLCGLVYHGMVLLDGDLWVASDLGLARGRPGELRVRHWDDFVPDPEGPEPMRPVTCGALYTELLESASQDPGERWRWSMLFQALVKLRPDSLEEIVLERIKQARPAQGP